MYLTPVELAIAITEFLALPAHCEVISVLALTVVAGLSAKERLVPVAVFVELVYLFHPVSLVGCAAVLVASDPPVQADWLKV